MKWTLKQYIANTVMEKCEKFMFKILHQGHKFFVFDKLKFVLLCRYLSLLSYFLSCKKEAYDLYRIAIFLTHSFLTKLHLFLQLLCYPNKSSFPNILGEYRFYSCSDGESFRTLVLIFYGLLNCDLGQSFNAFKTE